MPVATYASWTGGINVGGGRRLPLQMISDITVSPTHRRQGLLRTLITDDLADAAAAGLPLAALTVSEGTIYGRFGFGPASRGRSIEVDVTGRFALHSAAGRRRQRSSCSSRSEAWPAVQEVWARAHADDPRLGGPTGLLRHDPHRHATTGCTGDRTASCARSCTSTPTGRPDGYAIYRRAGSRGAADGRSWSTWWRSPRRRTPPVAVPRATSTSCERIRWRRAPPRGPGRVGGHRPARGRRRRALRDTLWLRLLDVPRRAGGPAMGSRRPGRAGRRGRARSRCRAAGGSPRATVDAEVARVRRLIRACG